MRFHGAGPNIDGPRWIDWSPENGPFFLLLAFIYFLKKYFFLFYFVFLFSILFLFYFLDSQGRKKVSQVSGGATFWEDIPGQKSAWSVRCPSERARAQDRPSGQDTNRGGWRYWWWHLHRVFISSPWSFTIAMWLPFCFYFVRIEFLFIWFLACCLSTTSFDRLAIETRSSTLHLTTGPKGPRPLGIGRPRLRYPTAGAGRCISLVDSWWLSPGWK